MKVYFIILIIVIALLFYFDSKKFEIMAAVADNATKLTRSQFIEKYMDIVKRVAKNTGLFPSLFMAQAILESNNGNSGLAKKYNNFFGVKADKKWTGKKVTLPTREVINGKDVTVNADFRVYDKPEDSFKDRVKFLQDNSNYKKAGVFIANTPEEQAAALQRAKYATDPKYSSILSGLINQYSLKTLDGYS